MLIGEQMTQEKAIFPFKRAYKWRGQWRPLENRAGDRIGVPGTWESVGKEEGSILDPTA